MSTGSFALYTAAKLALLGGQLDLATVKLQAVLLTGSYAPAESHSTYADIASNEVSGAAGTGYTTGGQAVTGQSVAASGSGAVFTAAQVNWPGSTFAAQYLALVQMAGATLAPTDLLVGYVTLAENGALAVVEAAFEVTWPATGIIEIT